jgi:hypothetical protein
LHFLLAELYDLCADPAEERDRSGDSDVRDRRVALENELEAWTATLSEARHCEEARLDRGVLDQLRALGYLG